MNIPRFQRVVLVVLDGLRPDAIDAFQLRHLAQLEHDGASTRAGDTVRPSVTAAAMGSLLTGVHPEQHGLDTDRFRLPQSAAAVEPLPATLRRAGFATSAFLAQTPFLYRRLAQLLARRAGVDHPHFIGANAEQITRSAAGALAAQRCGLMVFHLPDADRAGHQHGWMSSEYATAARDLDRALGYVREQADALAHCDTLFIACADHGGGGARANDHDSAHPLDVTIPIAMAGPGVRAGHRFSDASILDIPATILAALRIPIPASYAGCPLTDAFWTDEGRQVA